MLLLNDVLRIYGTQTKPPKEIKQEIIRRVSSGSSIRIMSDTYSISYTTIWNWINRPNGTNKK